jgi:hypothetical protein
MSNQRLRPRDLLDWISVVVDVAQILAFLSIGIGLLYWYASKRLPVVIVAIAFMLILLFGVVAWLAVKVSRPRS